MPVFADLRNLVVLEGFSALILGKVGTQEARFP